MLCISCSNTIFNDICSDMNAIVGVLTDMMYIQKSFHFMNFMEREFVNSRKNCYWISIKTNRHPLGVFLPREAAMLVRS